MFFYNFSCFTDSKIRRLLSNAKCRELSGTGIFGPPAEIPPRLAYARNVEPKGSKDMGEPAPRALRTSVKVSNHAGDQSKILFGEEAEVKELTYSEEMFLQDLLRSH
ncbi:uncharacterized protein LOC142546503 [Primulina tabacum]|uniref:uncharacterized protein LOC142546503 n=1 Tax=Primulina tabacum TaxID=48773 RepID=UPI003F59D15D